MLALLVKLDWLWNLTADNLSGQGCSQACFALPRGLSCQHSLVLL